VDGRFLSMPEFERAERFPSAADSLPAVPFGVWGGFVFASLAPAMPLAELLGGIEPRVGWLPWGELAFDAARSRDYLVRANWALYCDNYLEGFHIPYVHAGLAGALDYSGYRTELLPHGSLQVGIAAGGEEAFEIRPSAPTPDSASPPTTSGSSPTRCSTSTPGASRSTSCGRSPSTARGCRSSPTSGIPASSTAAPARASTASSARTRRSSRAS